MARILTAAVLIPLVILLLLKGPFWLLVVCAAAVAMLAAWEFLALAAATGASAPRILVLVCLGALFLALYFQREWLLPVFMAACLLLFSVISFRGPLKQVLFDTAVSIFALVYCGISMTVLPRLSLEDGGPALLVFLFFAVWSGDIAALYIGRAFGRHKLAPAISPNKTWEGSIASILGSMLVAGMLLLLAYFLQQHGFTILDYPGTVLHWLMLAALLNIAAQVGDLVESAVKRGADVKDSGTLLPGHGGVLDRIDALLFAAPVLWFAQIFQQSF